MTNSVQFEIGDRVICIDGYITRYTGQTGVVVNQYISGTKTVLQVVFDGEDKYKALYSFRFERDDGLSPVCRKIRQMEKRWQRFQTSKGKVNAMV